MIINNNNNNNNNTRQKEQICFQLLSSFVLVARRALQFLRTKIIPQFKLKLFQRYGFFKSKQKRIS